MVSVIGKLCEQMSEHVYWCICEQLDEFFYKKVNKQVRREVDTHVRKMIRWQVKRDFIRRVENCLSEEDISLLVELLSKVV